MPGKNSIPQPPETISSSATGGLHDQDPRGHVNHFYHFKFYNEPYFASDKTNS